MATILVPPSHPPGLFLQVQAVDPSPTGPYASVVHVMATGPDAWSATYTLPFAGPVRDDVGLPVQGGSFFFETSWEGMDFLPTVSCQESSVYVVSARLADYPVPEPAGLVLAAIGAVLLTLRHLRP